MAGRQSGDTWINAGLLLIILFHSNFSPSGEQPEHRKLAHEL